jgi:hypothetical protein
VWREEELRQYLPSDWQTGQEKGARPYLWDLLWAKRRPMAVRILEHSRKQREKVKPQLEICPEMIKAFIQNGALKSAPAEIKGLK